MAELFLESWRILEERLAVTTCPGWCHTRWHCHQPAGNIAELSSDVLETRSLGQRQHSPRPSVCTPGALWAPGPDMLTSFRVHLALSVSDLDQCVGLADIILSQVVDDEV